MTVRFRSERRFSDFIPAPSSPDRRRVRRYSELRRDPLTGRPGRVAHFLGFELRPIEMAETVERSRAHCPFCPPRLSAVTPLLPAEVAPEGRIHLGEATVFPNISPYDRHSVVVTLTAAHYLGLSGFQESQLAQGVLATAAYFRALRQPARGTYSVLTWNYMPPSGATQVHPHFQAFSTNRPGSLLEEEVARSRRHLARFGRTYWEELAEAEEELGERFVARGERTTWLTAFVSRSVVSDLLVLFPMRSRLEEMDDEDAHELARGLRLAFASLEAEGVRSFNLAFYAAPQGERSAHFRLHLRLSPRIYFNPAIEGSDTTAWQHLLDEPFMVRSPEALAQRMRIALAGGV